MVECLIEEPEIAQVRQRIAHRYFAKMSGRVINRLAQPLVHRRAQLPGIRAVTPAGDGDLSHNLRDLPRLVTTLHWQAAHRVARVVVRKRMEFSDQTIERRDDPVPRQPQNRAAAHGEPHGQRPRLVTQVRFGKPQPQARDF